MLECEITPLRSGHDQSILKDIPELIFDYFSEEVRPNLRDSPFIRLPVDTIPGQRIFVFEYLKENLLSLVKRGMSKQTAKNIPKDSLRGLVELHSQDINLDTWIIRNIHKTKMLKSGKSQTPRRTI